MPLLRRLSTGRAAPRPPRRDSALQLCVRPLTAAVSYRPPARLHRVRSAGGALMCCSDACARRLRRDRRQRTRPLARCCACRESFAPSAVGCALLLVRMSAVELSPPPVAARTRLGARATGRCRQRRISASSASSSRASSRAAALADIGKAEVRRDQLRRGAAGDRALRVSRHHARRCRASASGSSSASISAASSSTRTSPARTSAHGRATAMRARSSRWPAARACRGRIHTARAKLIRGSMRLLPERFKVVTATVDRGAGEVGTIYQACGFAYVGVMRSGGRVLIRRHDGSTLSGRQARRRFGTEGVSALRALGLDAVPVPRRARYFAFRGSRAERRRLRLAIQRLVKPYPTRVLKSAAEAPR